MFGVGVLADVAVDYGLIEPRTGDLLGHAHNLPLNLAAERGLLGLLAFVWVVVL